MSRLHYKQLIVLGLLLAVLTPSAGTTANITAGIDDDGDHYLILDGVITPGDAAKLADQIEAANTGGYRLDTLRLNSQGGSVGEAFQMAIMVRSVRNMATAVYKRSVCLSACFGIFAAGWRKYVDPAPDQIGVHSAAISGQETPETTSTTTFAARRLSAIGVPPQIIAQIVLTPPNALYYLTLDDLWAMSVNVTGFPRPPSLGPPHQPPNDPDPLFVARVIQDIPLNDGTAIRSGTLFVIWDQCSHVDSNVRMCAVRYSASTGIKDATLSAATLRVIGQGWGSAPRQPSQGPAPQPAPRQPTRPQEPLIQERCRVMDPTGTPLNVRASPNGAIIGTLPNGMLVSVIDHTLDKNGKPWVNVVSYETRRSIGWVFREFIACY
jgi:hypothetical protein